MSGFPETYGIPTLVPPPEGYIVDFENPQRQAVLEHYLIFGIGGPLAFIALMQRFYTKIFLSKGLQIDDAFMALAWVSSILTQALLTHAVSIKTLTAHAWEIPLDNFRKYQLLTYAAGGIFMLCNGFTKLSLLTFYLHISPEKPFRIAVWTSIGIVGVYTSVITTMLFVNCSPPRKAFDVTITEGHCIDVAILYIATAASNIFTDLILFILPIPTVLKLRMSNVQKIGAMCVFGIGSVTVATSIVRLVLLFPALASTDITWDAAPANIWSFLEANLFIICGSFPTLRKFFKHFAPKLMGSSNLSYGRSHSYGPSAYANAQSGVGRQRKDRSQYEQFPDENEMRTFTSKTREGDKERGVTMATVDAGSMVDQDTDGHSDKAILHGDKAIMQTTSFTVRYD
ncbi:uncharacterized protein E0L32_000405 [Thyridium curvatum]|uniref:Rhodopsin domain-containing protein n=1 Tax=Thyridium curvatum TaxID=1093900 RepID=A0A507BAB7_9PEZI|nr:uncharacterized protein E0L32_000405 [Thyridium curvatum]TPX14011.1 hypothetical protein E0L32_000405 [Thyridium curvatum]